MLSGSDKIIALRRLLDERHPVAPRRARRVVPTGVPRVDRLLEGGLATGALTEFVSEGASTGNQTALGSLIAATRLARQRLALIDAAGAFDLEGFDDDAVAHVVWVRCQALPECWRAADLVTRDPNYAVIVVDVRGHPVRELLRTKDSIWVRLQRAAETADTAIVVQTDSSIVPNASCRLAFVEKLKADNLTAPRHEIVAGVAPELLRRRARPMDLSA